MEGAVRDCELMEGGRQGVTWIVPTRLDFLVQRRFWVFPHFLDCALVFGPSFLICVHCERLDCITWGFCITAGLEPVTFCTKGVMYIVGADTVLYIPRQA